MSMTVTITIVTNSATPDCLACIGGQLKGSLAFLLTALHPHRAGHLIDHHPG